MNTKAMIFTRPRDTVSFFVGLVLLAFGVVPLLNTMGVIKFTWPFNLALSILVWIVAAAGAYVVIDGFIEPPQHSLHWFLIAAGLLLLIIGLIPILNTFGIIGFKLGFLDSLIVYDALITIEGILLLIGGLTEH
jgi:hypothetical protein